MVRLVGESLGVGQYRLDGRGVSVWAKGGGREHEKERLGARAQAAT